jgi:hypothetical protein
MAMAEVGAQLGPLLAQLAALAVLNWTLSLPGLLWIGLYWILFQLARWNPPAAALTSAAPTYDPPRRPERIGLSPADKLRAARARAAATRRRAFEGRRSFKGGCSRHGYHKQFPLKLRDPDAYKKVPPRYGQTPLRSSSSSRARHARSRPALYDPQSHFWLGRRSTPAVGTQVGAAVQVGDAVGREAAPSNQAKTLQEPPLRALGSSSDPRGLWLAG